MKVIFGSVDKLFFKAADCVISEITDKTACELRSVRENRGGMLGKNTVVKLYGVGTVKLFGNAVLDYLSGRTAYFYFCFRVDTDKRITSPLFRIINAFKN